MSSIYTLRGLRVLEFSHAVLGPACGLILADLGAEVIRIEPVTGDPTRSLKGFGTGYYPFFNRNKKSVAINLKCEDGRALVLRLLETADVLIENFAPGTMERLGLGYEALAPRYPHLIYCALKGFLSGPYANRLALDEVVQMMSGLAYMTGPPGQPLRVGASVIDVMSGTYGALAILAALRERDAAGKGQLVHSALFETAVFLMGHHMAYAAMTGEPVPPMPARVSAWAIYRTFTTSDGELVFIGVTSDKQWRRFCQVFHQDDWLADERLATNNGRIQAREWLLTAVEAIIAQYPTAEIVQRCQEADLPFSPVVRPEDLFTDPQLQASGSLLQTILPNGEYTWLPRLPILLHEIGATLQIDPPALGEHSRQVLAAIGLQSQEIESLIQQGIVAG
ncbi:MAG: CoA transferase [Chloroflexi bacterium]|nr:CoA transferase [Ardenticatenaceae bacterium]MBL1127908.1 CoA transferase [Chloroflexota bacterium]NOG33978.1 CoA transferase [Chloroflexota bacterium]GIK55663.1 MAG: CoA transferase [Chloroflexota bacterium]